MSIRDLETTVDWVTVPADPSAWCYERAWCYEPQIYHAACPLIPEDAQHHYEHDAPVFGLSDGTVVGREYKPVGRGITDVYELLQFECSCGSVARAVHFADLILEDDE